MSGISDPAALWDAFLTDPSKVTAKDVALTWTSHITPRNTFPEIDWLGLFLHVGLHDLKGRPLERPNHTDTLTVYRGAHENEWETRNFGFAWSTSRQKAMVFATRNPTSFPRVLLRAEVRWQFVLADYRARIGPSEVICDPSRVPLAVKGEFDIAKVWQEGRRPLVRVVRHSSPDLETRPDSLAVWNNLPEGSK